MKTDEIVDWHGGLYDIREGILKTPVDAAVALDNDANTALRALRFKARYGYDFAPDLEKVMREKGKDYLSSLGAGTLRTQVSRMFGKGFAANSLNVVTDYRMLSVLFPSLNGKEDDAAYLLYAKKVLELIDDCYAANGQVNDSLFMGALLWPAVEEKAKTVGFENALQETLAKENERYDFSAKTRGELEDLLRLENDLTTRFAASDSDNPRFADALIILKARAAQEKRTAKTLQRWQNAEQPVRMAA